FAASVEAAKRVGFDLTTVSNDGGMDANQITAHGIPAVTIAVGQRQVHTADEWIDLADFERACRVVVELGVG
ncbi:MAG: M20/M25/M40 family metallo-hydrolase, partial [Pseudomonadota bacterium]